jgi:hypothetical protein
MSDAALFVLVFGGLFILRGIAATIVFLWILPDGIRCPQCDAETMRVESGGALLCCGSFARVGAWRADGMGCIAL